MKSGIYRTKFLMLMTAMALVGCAAHYTPAAIQDPYGFWSGIWHGILCPWAILANLASWTLDLVEIHILDSIQIVGRPNTGVFWYYVGFALGLGSYFGAAQTP